MKLNLAGSADEEEGKDGEDCGHKEGARGLAGAEGHAVHGHEGAAVFGRCRHEYRVIGSNLKPDS